MAEEFKKPYVPEGGVDRSKGGEDAGAPKEEDAPDEDLEEDEE